MQRIIKRFLLSVKRLWAVRRLITKKKKKKEGERFFANCKIKHVLRAISRILLLRLVLKFRNAGNRKFGARFREKSTRKIVSRGNLIKVADLIG